MRYFTSYKYYRVPLNYDITSSIYYRVPLNYDIFHYLISECSAVAIQVFLSRSPSVEDLKIISGKSTGGVKKHAVQFTTVLLKPLSE